MTFREFTEDTPFKTSIGRMIALLALTAGGALAFNAKIDTTAAQAKGELRTERVEALKPYMTREEFWLRVQPEMAELKAEMREVKADVRAVKERLK